MSSLPGFDYAPRYTTWRDWRVHYVDEGKGERTFLCLHGEPTWSYLYRRMIPRFVATGARVVAPDFVGFGFSDKPENEALYTFDFHRQFLLDLIQRLELKRITLVVQDWGGLLGLTLPMEVPAIEKLFVMNTALATGDVPLSEGFVAWRAYVAKNPDLACGKLMARACPHLSAAEAAAYDAPFPTVASKAGVRRFPPIVPEKPDDPGAAISRKARDWLSTSWKGETFMAVGAKDPVLGVPVMKLLRSWIRGCPEPVVIENGGHFLQEWGDEVLDAWSATKT
ncbi:MAG TPA: haloalkane dehalogenase [Burkholderiales bacterium]|nr:haloalkane dehalogenase [Burkholderiales bacterium]